MSDTWFDIKPSKTLYDTIMIQQVGESGFKTSDEHNLSLDRRHTFGKTLSESVTRKCKKVDRES